MKQKNTRPLVNKLQCAVLKLYELNIIIKTC